MDGSPQHTHPAKKKGYGTLQQPIAMDGSLQHTHSRLVCGTPARRKVMAGGGRSRQEEDHSRLELQYSKDGRTILQVSTHNNQD